MYRVDRDACERLWLSYLYRRGDLPKWMELTESEARLVLREWYSKVSSVGQI